MGIFHLMSEVPRKENETDICADVIGFTGINDEVATLIYYNYKDESWRNYEHKEVKKYKLWSYVEYPDEELTKQIEP